MVFTYTYSIATTFPDGIDTGELHQLIANSSITTQFFGINTLDDQLFIRFLNELSSPEFTTLSNIITSYEYNPIETFSKQIVLTPKNAYYQSRFYTKIATLIYDGNSILSKCQIESFIDKTGTYSIILEWTDSENTTYTIGSGTFSNTKSSINTISPLTNLPTVHTPITISAKASTNSIKIYIDSITIMIN